MPQHPTLSDDTVKHEPLPDETVRMRADGPAPDGGPSASPAPPTDAADETRPVTRDWLLGAPDSDAGRPDAPVAAAAAVSAPAPVVPGSDDDWHTEAFDRTSGIESLPAEDDATTTLDAVPDEYDGGDDGRPAAQPAPARPLGDGGTG